MNKKITAFIKNGLIITFLIILGFFISSKTQYDVSATGGSECSQSGECYLYENPGNSGSYTYNTVISSAVIKAGDNLFTFNPGDSNDGCYQVNINNDQIQWNKLQDSSTCQDISPIQIW